MFRGTKIEIQKVYWKCSTNDSTFLLSSIQASLAFFFLHSFILSFTPLYFVPDITLSVWSFCFFESKPLQVSLLGFLKGNTETWMHGMCIYIKRKSNFSLRRNWFMSVWKTTGLMQIQAHNVSLRLKNMTTAWEHWTQTYSSVNKYLPFINILISSYTHDYLR